MPNIRETQAPGDLGLRPDDRATESTANAGRRIAGLYGQAAEATNDMGRRLVNGGMDVGNVAVKYMEHREISAGAAESAKTLAGLDAKWNEISSKADPNDGTIAARFREETVEPVLEKLRDGFMTEGGQKFAEAQVESFRNHFVQKTAADMSRLAKVATTNNIETLKNQLSNMAINDPTSLNASLGLAEKSIGAMVDSSNMSGVDAATAKIELTQSTQAAIVKAAAIGAINANPEAGLKEFSSEKYSKWIGASDVRALEQEAKKTERAKRVDENLALQNQKLFKQEASDNREREYLQKIHSDDPKERASVSASQIARDYTLTREASERMIAMADRSTKPETDAKISKETSVQLFNRIRADDNTDLPKMKGWIDDAYSAGNLSWGDRTNLQKEVEDRKTPEGLALAQDRAQFFKQYAGAIAGRMYDPVIGSPKLYNAERDARRVEQDLKQKGIDPHLAYDPTSEYFIGKKVSKWSGSMQSDLGTKAAIASDGALPAPLRGIASLTYIPAQQMYRDDTTGKFYNRDGSDAGSAAPPMEGARRANDGNWYVEKDGKFFRVDK